MVWRRNSGGEAHEEWVWGGGGRVIRLYVSFPHGKPARIRLDLSQVRDKEWPVYKALLSAYGRQPLFEYSPELRDQLMSYIAQEDRKLQAQEAKASAPKPAPWYADPERVLR